MLNKQWETLQIEGEKLGFENVGVQARQELLLYFEEQEQKRMMAASAAAAAAGDPAAAQAQDQWAGYPGQEAPVGPHDPSWYGGGPEGYPPGTEQQGAPAAYPDEHHG